MIYSKQYKTIFVHNQKTGGSSIEQYFEEHVPDAKVVLPRHTYVTQGMQKLGPDWEGNYVFGFVRNPWARLVSWYSMIAERPEEGKKNPLFAYVRENASSLPKFSLELTNSTSKKDYRKFYTNETRKLVADRFAKDIEYFGYEF